MEPSSSMPEHIGPHGSPSPRARRGAPIFDDVSPQLDRFRSVLALAFVTVTLLSLVDLGGGAAGGWKAVATSSVIVLIAMLVGLWIHGRSQER